MGDLVGRSSTIEGPFLSRIRRLLSAVIQGPVGRAEMELPIRVGGASNAVPPTGQRPFGHEAVTEAWRHIRIGPVRRSALTTTESPRIPEFPDHQ